MSDCSGTAFPVNMGSYIAEGISKRDYFAVAALQGIMANLRDYPALETPWDMANHCYLIADAMLEAREK